MIASLIREPEKNWSNLANIEKKKTELTNSKKKLAKDSSLKEVGFVQLVEGKKKVIGTVDSWKAVFDLACAKMSIIFPSTKIFQKHVVLSGMRSSHTM